MANISSQRFCLRWNNHQSNLLSVFDQLLQDESFVDVTLAVDGQFLRAHKMVLSACSPYFQSLFTDHPDKHPIVILKDVPYTDMRCLLDFMYRGEVSVDQDRLTAFLKLQKVYGLKQLYHDKIVAYSHSGLTEVNEEKCDLPSITNSLLGSQNLHSHVPPPQLHRIYQPPSLKRAQVHNNNFPSLNSAPLLGSALTAPKRKRGRPRKLSGSSDFAPGSPNSDTDASDAKTSESILPELLEVKMEYSDKDRNRESSCENERYSNGEERRERLNNENEHLAGTSHVERGNGHDSESFALEDGYSKLSYLICLNALILNALLRPKIKRRSSEESTGGNLVIDFNNMATKSEGNVYSSNTNTSGSPNTSNENASVVSASTTPQTVPKPVVRRRVRRRANSSSQDPAEQLTEMSVRGKQKIYECLKKQKAEDKAIIARLISSEMLSSGLNLFRYASVQEGLYKCTECEKSDVLKTFKNKYSFQRHAFLYHEGHQRKVFPCPVCQKEFSRPDKMKNHMKTVHECFVPKDVFPPSPVTGGYFLTPPQLQQQQQQQHLQLKPPQVTNSSSRSTNPLSSPMPPQP
ncbi:tramtrack, putative [Pediculus humanus corporis]|uniref:Tramtrack, putative n=1 Tax=Pediculus humanus subsp. corporis TaxID=121224 RepID=E0VWP9_PEDHC|nr:tramtrack, putative [Pediculus humanus corporis]EEB17805.1 tramtrack, putative [Pediculus humanus corporis]